jgi:hypothetical protein
MLVMRPEPVPPLRKGTTDGSLPGVAADARAARGSICRARLAHAGLHQSTIISILTASENVSADGYITWPGAVIPGAGAYQTS